MPCLRCSARGRSTACSCRASSRRGPARSGRSTSGRCTRRSSASSGTDSSRPATEKASGRRSATGSRPPATASWPTWLRTPPDLVPPPRDELVIKVLVALQVPGIDVHEILQVHRRHVIELMQRYTQVKAAAGEDDVALALVADAELFRLEAIVRWLDAADVRLKQRRRSRRPPTADAAARTDSHDGGLAMTSALELRQVSKVYGSGPTEVHALRDVDLSVERRRARGDHGPERLGQEHAPDDRRQPRGARRAARCSSTASTSATRLAQRSGADAPPLDRLRVPGLQPARRADRGRERHAAARARRHPRRRARARPALEALEELDVAERADRFPDELSGGERQRVAIARAVVGERGSAARRRADRRARLGQRRGGHAPAARRHASAASPVSS